MTTTELHTAYNEAKLECEKYINYNGDKRKYIYKLMQHRVIDLWMIRMNFLAKRLSLPTFNETFYN